MENQLPYRPEAVQVILKACNLPISGDESQDEKTLADYISREITAFTVRYGLTEVDEENERGNGLSRSSTRIVNPFMDIYGFCVDVPISFQEIEVWGSAYRAVFASDFAYQESAHLYDEISALIGINDKGYLSSPQRNKELFAEWKFNGCIREPI